jgi:two-component system response regulator (stage 0 sporulation protein F)
VNILVVDDEGAFGKLVGRVLSREGMQVTTTTRGAEAVTALEQTEPRLVIVDYLLREERDGLDLIEIMRARRPRLPALLISGFPSEDVEQKVATMPATYYLEKPFESDELLSLVRYIITREKAPPGGDDRDGRPEGGAGSSRGGGGLC